MSSYLDHLEDARDALGDLLAITEPGTGIILHRAYAELKWAIEKETRDLQPAKPTPSEIKSEFDANRWINALAMEQRERQVLQALSERPLAVSALTSHLRAAPENEELHIYESNVRVVVRKLFVAKELDRREFYVGRRLGYRYFRRTELAGPIADLQRAFDGPDQPERQ